MSQDFYYANVCCDSLKSCEGLKNFLSFFVLSIWDFKYLGKASRQRNIGVNNL